MYVSITFVSETAARSGPSDVRNGGDPLVLTGRDDWLGRFDDYFRGLVGGYPIEHVCFWGPRGMGKTVLLERLVRWPGSAELSPGG